MMWFKVSKPATRISKIRYTKVFFPNSCALQMTISSLKALEWEWTLQNHHLVSAASNSICLAEHSQVTSNQSAVTCSHLSAIRNISPTVDFPNVTFSLWLAHFWTSLRLTQGWSPLYSQICFFCPAVTSTHWRLAGLQLISSVWHFHIHMKLITCVEFMQNLFRF